MSKPVYSKIYSEQPLTAIGQARYLALLLMDIYSKTTNFRVYNDFAHDREFYAQVANGQSFPIPKNSSSQFLRTLSLKHPVQIRRLRTLLRLPNLVWNWADDLGWTENFIRQELLAEAKDELELIALAANYAFAENYFGNLPTQNPLSIYQHLFLAQTPAEVNRILVDRRAFRRLMLDVKKAILSMDSEDKQAAIQWMKNMISNAEAK